MQHDSNRQVTTNNDDLTDLLNEAKATILELQEKTESLKTEIDTLRHQNQDYSKQIEAFLNCSNDAKVSPTIDAHPPPIPLEPIVIVKENRGKNDSKCSQSVNAKTEHNDTVANLNYELDCSESSQSSQSDNTNLV